MNQSNEMNFPRLHCWFKEPSVCGQNLSTVVAWQFFAEHSEDKCSWVPSWPNGQYKGWIHPELLGVCWVPLRGCQEPGPRLSLTYHVCWQNCLNSSQDRSSLREVLADINKVSIENSKRCFVTSCLFRNISHTTDHKMTRLSLGRHMCRDNIYSPEVSIT